MRFGWLGWLFLGARACEYARRSELNDMFTPAMVEQGLDDGVASEEAAFVRAHIRQRVARIFERLERGGSARIIINGGSFTNGNGCLNGDGNDRNYSRILPCAERNDVKAIIGRKPSVRGRWPAILVDWLRRAYPNATVVSTVNALGSTTTHYGYALLRDHIARDDVDLVIFDYGCNDKGDSADDARGLAHALEASARLALDCGAAFVVMRTCFHLNLQEVDWLQHLVYENVTRYYGVPLASYSDAVSSRVNRAYAIADAVRLKEQDAPKSFDPSLFLVNSACPQPEAATNAWTRHHCLMWRNVLYWDSVARAHHHPGCVSRLFVFHFVREALLRMLRLSATTTADLSPLRLPAPRFGAPVNSSSSETQPDEACAPHLTEYSALVEGGANSSFARPWIQPSTDTSRETIREHACSETAYCVGWRFRKDSQHHPRGWIAKSSKRRNASAAAWIAFPVFLVEGAVTVTFLETYRDAGVIEIWVGTVPHDFTSNGGYTSQEPQAENMYKRTPQPGMPQDGPYSLYTTRSVFIDTYNPAHNSSEHKMRTLMMGAHGKQLLHMRHAGPQERSARGVLSKAEVRRRGGDKVKIVELRAC